MDMQQLMQQLLANAKANQEDLLARMDANTKEINAKMDANQAKATKQEKMLANMDTNRNEMMEEIKSGEAEMRSTTRAFWSELKEIIQHEMKAVIQPIRSELGEMIACNGVTETEPDPEMMQSIEEHQAIPKEDAAVMPIGGPRKRHRVCNLAAEHRQKMRERTRGNSGSRRKLAGACKKVSCRAKVAWRERNLIRKFRTLEKCGQ
jgi:hypothetical protein